MVAWKCRCAKTVLQEFRMGEVTIKTIASEAGVSTSLVSQVLNHRPVRVAETTRQRIIATARNLHYQPNIIAASLKLKKTKTIALVAPFTPYGFFSNLVYNVQNHAYRAGYLTMVVNTFEQEEREVEELELFQSGMFDGMLVAPLSHGKGKGVLEAMKAASFPFLCVDRIHAGMDLAYVGSDHRGVGRRLTDDALAEGLRNIVFMYRGDSRNTAGEERLEGYRDAMTRASLPPQVLHFRYGAGEDAVASMAEALGSLPSRPEAVFLHSGYYLPFLAEACRRIGWDLRSLEFLMVDGFSFSEGSLAGWDWMGRVIGHCRVAIQDIDAIARMAVASLVDRIAGKETGTAVRLVPAGFQRF